MKQLITMYGGCSFANGKDWFEKKPKPRISDVQKAMVLEALDNEDKILRWLAGKGGAPKVKSFSQEGALRMDRLPGLTALEARKTLAQQPEVFLQQMLQKLKEVHGVGVAHGDLSATNMLVSFNQENKLETLRLIDFGFAKIGNELQEEQVFRGTLPFASTLAQCGILSCFPADLEACFALALWASTGSLPWSDLQGQIQYLDAFKAKFASDSLVNLLLGASNFAHSDLLEFDLQHVETSKMWGEFKSEGVEAKKIPRESRRSVTVPQLPPNEFLALLSTSCDVRSWLGTVSRSSLRIEEDDAQVTVSATIEGKFYMATESVPKGGLTTMAIETAMIRILCAAGQKNVLISTQALAQAQAQVTAKAAQAGNVSAQMVNISTQGRSQSEAKLLESVTAIGVDCGEKHLIRLCGAGTSWRLPVLLPDDHAALRQFRKLFRKQRETEFDLLGDSGQQPSHTTITQATPWEKVKLMLMPCVRPLVIGESTRITDGPKLQEIIESHLVKLELRATLLQYIDDRVCNPRNVNIRIVLAFRTHDDALLQQAITSVKSFLSEQPFRYGRLNFLQARGLFTIVGDRESLSQVSRVLRSLDQTLTGSVEAKAAIEAEVKQYAEKLEGFANEAKVVLDDARKDPQPDKELIRQLAAHWIAACNKRDAAWADFVELQKKELPR